MNKELECQEQNELTNFDSETVKNNIRQIKCAFFRLVLAQIERIKCLEQLPPTEVKTPLSSFMKGEEKPCNEPPTSPSPTDEKVRTRSRSSSGTRISPKNNNEVPSFEIHPTIKALCTINNSSPTKSNNKNSRSHSKTYFQTSPSSSPQIKGSIYESSTSVYDTCSNTCSTVHGSSTQTYSEACDRSVQSNDDRVGSTHNNQIVNQTAPETRNTHSFFKSLMKTLIIVLFIWILFIAGLYLGGEFCYCFPKRCSSSQTKILRY